VATASSDSGSDVSFMLWSSRADSSAIKRQRHRVEQHVDLVKLAFSERRPAR
jgi:hypothetical protein